MAGLAWSGTVLNLMTNSRVECLGIRPAFIAAGWALSAVRLEAARPSRSGNQPVTDCFSEDRSTISQPRLWFSDPGHGASDRSSVPVRLKRVTAVLPSRSRPPVLQAPRSAPKPSEPALVRARLGRLPRANLRGLRCNLQHRTRLEKRRRNHQDSSFGRNTRAILSECDAATESWCTAKHRRNPACNRLISLSFLWRHLGPRSHALFTMTNTRNRSISSFFSFRRRQIVVNFMGMGLCSVHPGRSSVIRASGYVREVALCRSGFCQLSPCQSP
jgi:hypothetical protein